MNSQQTLPKYDCAQSYDWNFERAPDPVTAEVPEVPGKWTFCGLPAASPLGIPAGPLLNGRWVQYYASLGFDVLTYKTVRSVERKCYPLPNLLPVTTGQLSGRESRLTAAQTMNGSWAVSFGMPSKPPGFWRADVERTRARLAPGKVLSVSVVGSIQEGWTLEDLADDYARCARWAVESGADCVETNFSCPNVSTCDGQLYQQHTSAKVVAERVRAAIGNAPYIVKVGHVSEVSEAAQLLDAVAPFADALAMTNSVATTVRSSDGELYFGGEARGICGDGTRSASIEQTRLFSRLIRERRLETRIIGVGGASTAVNVRQYLRAGAETVQIATAAMIDPLVGIRIKRELAASPCDERA